MFNINEIKSTLFDLNDIALQNNNVPISAILLGAEGNILSSGSNSDSLHAEEIVLNNHLLKKDLKGTTLFVTSEPCPMCFTKAALRGVSKVFYFLENSKFGVTNFIKYDVLNMGIYKNISLLKLSDDLTYKPQLQKYFQGVRNV